MLYVSLSLCFVDSKPIFKIDGQTERQLQHFVKSHKRFRFCMCAHTQTHTVYSSALMVENNQHKQKIYQKNLASPSSTSFCLHNCISIVCSFFPPSDLLSVHPLFHVIHLIHLSLPPSSISPCPRMLSHSLGVRQRLQNNSSVSSLSAVL